MTMLRVIITTWLTPSISSGRADGTRMRQSCWRRVQPAMRPNSWISPGTCCKARTVARTMGGTEKVNVAISAEDGLLPNSISIGTR